MFWPAAMAIALYAGSPANDTELRAAYCAAAMKIIVSMEKEAASSPRATEATRASLRLMIAQDENTYSRLREYVMLKSKAGDPEALLVAMQRAETDSKVGIEVGSNCSEVGNADQGACFSSAMDKIFATPEYQRLMACRKVDWLPF